jgi:hypothetical protein
MRLRLLGLAVASALVFTVLTRGAGPSSRPAGRPESRVPAAESPATPTSAEAADPLPPPPARDIFRYAEPPTRRDEPAPEGGEARNRNRAGETPRPEAALPLRLVGLVRRAEGLRAAVATASGLVMVGPGDVVEGYAVLGVDEDGGLRLRGPDGSERVLLPGS